MFSLAQKFNEGGIFMYFILLFGVLTIGLIVERTVTLYFKTKEISPNFRKEVLDAIANGELNVAENIALTKGAGTSVGKIVAIGCHLKGNGGGEEEIQARMDEALTSEISSLDRRTAFLAMFGNVSTLLGLLGTISGMIHSFAAVANASPADRATMLSRGISEAMNCTAFGLIVAIPALVAYAVMQNKTERLVVKMTEMTTQIFHDLLFLAETPSAKVTKSSAKVYPSKNSPSLDV